MIRYAALAALAALAACGPEPDGYVYGGASSGYGYGYDPGYYDPGYYDRPYWGPSYQYDRPGYRGRPHGGYDHRGGPPASTPQSRQFWGMDGGRGNSGRGPGPRAEPPRPPPQAAPQPPRGGGGFFGGRGRESPRVEQGAD